MGGAVAPLGFGRKVSVASFDDIRDVAASANGSKTDEAEQGNDGRESMHA